MSDKNLGCTVFAISAIILAISTFNIFNKRENFTETESAQTETNAKFSSGPGFENTQRLQEYQNRVVMNTGTSTEQVNKIGAQYYLNLQNYLNPSIQNLEMAQNISSQRIQAGVHLPGASSSYSNKNGNGYVDNLSYIQEQCRITDMNINFSNQNLTKCKERVAEINKALMEIKDIIDDKFIGTLQSRTRTHILDNRPYFSKDVDYKKKIVIKNQTLKIKQKPRD